MPSSSAVSACWRSSRADRIKAFLRSSGSSLIAFSRAINSSRRSALWSGLRPVARSRLGSPPSSAGASKDVVCREYWHFRSRAKGCGGRQSSRSPQPNEGPHRRFDVSAYRRVGKGTGWKGQVKIQGRAFYIAVLTRDFCSAETYGATRASRRFFD